MAEPLRWALTYHVEAPRQAASKSAYGEVIRQVELADSLGFDYAWFSEHHAHAHCGHLPAPLLLALHLAGRTTRIQVGTAIICLNLHHPVDVAEQVAVAETLAPGRISIGFGSGSTPAEFGLFGLPVTENVVRHERFEEALGLILQCWSGAVCRGKGNHFQVPHHRFLPLPSPDLPARSWVAVNSAGSAAIAGRLGFNMMFSHLRTPEQYREYQSRYREAGGRGLVAANRPIYVGADAASASREAEPAVRALWRRFRSEGKIPGDATEPDTLQELCGHPINFLVGGPEDAAQQIRALKAAVPFDVLNLEPQWAGIPAELAERSLERISREVRPLLGEEP